MLSKRGFERDSEHGDGFLVLTKGKMPVGRVTEFDTDGKPTWYWESVDRAVAEIDVGGAAVAAANAGQFYSPFVKCFEGLTPNEIGF
ncbi:unnamed protein product [marine sediment metagenome]|uniref:Uncharacterized protein n=1 Tax=marine sediment metagenome TaxID=412755 RepID=X0YSY4_9ZZZZ